MFASELTVAFFDMEPRAGDNVLIIALFTVLGAVPLLLGAWVSPGRRWQELGITTLIAAGLVLLCNVTMPVLLMDPQFVRYIPPMPDLRLAPVVGLMNLLLVTGIGWLLYRGRRSDA